MSSRFAFGIERDAEIRRHVGGDRDLVGRRRVGEQPPLGVEDQLLRGEPAHALHEAALDLADVDRRVQRASDVVEDVDARHAVLAGERVDDHLEQAAP